MNENQPFSHDVKDLSRQEIDDKKRLEDEKRLDDIADKLGSYSLARAFLGLPLEEDESILPTRATAKKREPPHYSRRGGRAFPEPSDSELDPHWNDVSWQAPESDDERKIIVEGVRKVREAIDDARKARQPQPEVYDRQEAQRQVDECWGDELDFEKEK